MFERKKRMINGKTVFVIDATKAAYTQFGIGVVKGNPKLCLHCRKPIRKGERWIKQVSEEDPDYGRYTVIRHSQCNGTYGSN